MKWLKKVKKQLLSIFVSPFTVNWKNWEECYDYGVDKAFFLTGSLCQCVHRDYSHRYFRDVDTQLLGDEKCKACSCQQFKAMSNLDWLEYSDVRIAEIEKLCSRDLYDYFRAVAKGEKTLVKVKS